MKYLNEYQNPEQVRALARRIAQLATTPSCFMEVCGTHSHAIARYGLRELLPDNLRLVSGPGCPVCVTPPEVIDAALELAGSGVWLATFGDMMKVPGSRASLGELKAQGAQFKVVYSPLQAVQWAQENPRQPITFIGVGFETTAPSVAVCILEAQRLALDNFTVLLAHKLVPPALRALVSQPDVRIDGFLCPGHVSVIIGSRPYEPLAQAGVPCVIAGFEPSDILQSVQELARMNREGTAAVVIQYRRVVKAEGNPTALAKMSQVFQIADTRWRGLGEIPASGLGIRDTYARFDAQRRFDLHLHPVPEPAGCECGAILRGVKRPVECALFGTACRPEHAIGPCMVSSEGACAAVYRYETQARQTS